MTTDLPTGSGADGLRGSRDPATGQIYFPARVLAADGSLRLCEPVALSQRGRLASWTRFAGRFYGQVDLPEGVRIQGRLGEGQHRIGADYHLCSDADGWRFDRV
jgi:Predicted nucleic-acid-binding protein containing a Zn-ribbon